MDSTIASKPRPRPAHTQGTTRCAYTPDGSRLVTVGSNNTIRLYKTGSDGEPINIDDCQEQNMAVAAGDEFFVVGSEDGTVSLYSLETNTFERFLTRTVLPIRDVALTNDRQWCAVASDELSVKIVNTKDITQVKHLREHARAVRNVSFDPQGRLVALSGTDGIVYVYSLTAEEPELIRKVDGIIGAIDGDSETSTRVAWHPDGRAFAVPTPVRDIQIISKNDWEKQRTFANGHLADITAIAWSPNGAMLASASKDGKVLIWETKTQSVIARYDYFNVIDIFSPLLKLATQPAPFIHDPLAELSANRRPPPVNGQKQQGLPTRPRRESLGSLDSFLEGGDGYGDDDFVEDDDGAGYTIGQGQKRARDGDDGYGTSNKRRHMLEPQYHEAFQPGATPWRGNRKYLCLNLIGFVWTVDQDSHHTVTVEFYDHELHRDFHFSDTFLYDKACLTEHGTLFSCPPKDDAPAVIFYRPHETWTQRYDWRIELPKDEAVTAMSLSESFITVTTSANYVRVYTLFGMPYRVYRPKSTPMVTCASWRDYVLTMGNGPMGADGNTRLLYTIENVKRDEICQNEDTVALPEGATLKSVFFSDNGDPCIYDSTGTLLTLLHWRQPSRASWVPLLDTKLLDRLASGRKNESYFPIAVADNKFHCIILKGETRKLEQQFMLHNVKAAQLRDLVEATSSSHTQRSQLSRLELEIDKTLLQLLAVECREGEERGMRALEMVQLMRDRTGRMMEAAGRVAERYGRTILGEKIREVGEKRIEGLEDDDFP
ncbi:hypothetical protein ACJA88_010265 [Fusarium oxysporum]